MRKGTNAQPQVTDQEQTNFGQPDDQGHDAVHTDSMDHDRIAARAYERFQARGGEPDRDQEDWFEAERELRGEGSS